MNNQEQIFKLINEEKDRQLGGLELIASENFTSENVMKATGSILTNKYAEGYPGKRYYGGCEVVDKIENIAIDRLKKLFKVEYANVQPHSGSQATCSSNLNFNIKNFRNSFVGGKFMSNSPSWRICYIPKPFLKFKVINFINYTVNIKINF